MIAQTFISIHYDRILAVDERSLFIGESCDAASKIIQQQSRISLK